MNPKKKHLLFLLLGFTSTPAYTTEAISIQTDTEFMQSPKALKNFIQDEIQKGIQKALGFINPFEILEKSEEYQDGVTNIKKDFEAKQTQLRSIEETAMKRKTELEQMGQALSPSARERKIEELGNLEAQHRIKVQSMQESARAAEEELRMHILKKIQDEAELFSREEGRIMVVAGGVIYGAKPIDLTAKVLERLNAKYRAEKAKRAKHKNESRDAENK